MKQRCSANAIKNGLAGIGGNVIYPEPAPGFSPGAEEWYRRAAGEQWVTEDTRPKIGDPGSLIIDIDCT